MSNISDTLVLHTEMGRLTIISFLVLVTLTAKAHSNLIPEITTDDLIRVREDTPVGHRAFMINATDPEGVPLRYSFKSVSALFQPNPTTGEVTVKSPLDREGQEVHTLMLVVSDGVYTDVQKTVTVVLEDGNDNQPVFQGTPYNAKIPENAALGTTVLRVSAKDADSGTSGYVGYYMSGVTPSDGAGLFEIGERTGAITLMGGLSFTEKSTFYQLDVTAKDGGGILEGQQVIQSSSVFIFVNVEDVPDIDPLFVNLPSTATVEEGTPSGTSVFKVRARDPDTGINSPIKYSIASASATGLFQIDEDSGVISVQAPFDREQYLESDGVITLEIKAEESTPNVHDVNAFATSEIQITIRDVNDNKPEFYDCTEACVIQNTFSGNIDEHSAVGLSVLGLSMKVIDGDKGENSTFTLSIEGPGKDAFSVSPSRAVSNTIVQILMKTPADVDFEKGAFMTVKLIAVDTKKEEFKSTATVTITINDINDNSPKFKQETYNLEIEEHSPAGTEIATITATDPDTEDVGNIVYKLLPESMLEFFNVDPDTGRITVENGDLLDREGRSFYSANLQAKDKANNTGTAILEITLLDKNDNAPKMIRESYIAFVNEGPGVNLKLQIQAIDDDQPGTDNSKIEYQIVESEFSHDFTINKDTGILKMTDALDREALDPALNGVIELNVTAYDKGIPPLGTSVIVEINVGDINDNSPLFQKKEYNFEVKESEKGAFINSVLAKDKDQTEMNNRISFSITGGSSGTFSVRSVPAPNNTGYWGNISVDQDIELDYETRKTYTFKVQALDLDRKEDSATVILKVLDVNDETPSLKTGLVIETKENNTVDGGVIGKIVGDDKDTVHQLEYELLRTECPCNESGVCQEEWFLVEPSGNVKINPEYVVDYESCHEVILHVQVTDTLTELGKNSSEGTITVRIEDINDHVPEFIQTQPNFVVAESTDRDTSVASVSATDRDSGENAIITFEVLAVRFVNNNNETEDLNKIFKVDQPPTPSDNTGIIRSLQSLDASKKGRYVITVEVKDKGGLSSTSEVVIFTVDQTFKVSLEFRSTAEDFANNQANIKWALESSTGTTVHIVKVSGQTEQRAAALTIVEAYFIFPDGTALQHDTVLNMVNGNGNTEYRDVLLGQGLSGVNAGSEDNQGEGNIEMFLLLGVVGGLVIVLIVMSTLLVFMRRNYQRKLKAAKAMNSATMSISENQKSGPVVPGTNKYTMEGANPVLNLNIETTTDLGFDEEDSNNDRSSLNSLDYNIDMNMSEKDTMPMMVIEEEDEENGQNYYEPLGAALAQRGKRKGGEDTPSLTFDNPALSTTDL
ncbi:cadherin-related family member 2-like isoform X3 [Clupea harengus]|uniref:Cadherin-related family member 2-like isoform X3 n=1 Tax=Clupea harengus TaxID=7950 RepID=A0A6P8H5W9_CLUHA|nr:cadherin-related family member 2-like isoform X3 [Clupea harengus]